MVNKIALILHFRVMLITVSMNRLILKTKRCQSCSSCFHLVINLTFRYGSWKLIVGCSTVIGCSRYKRGHMIGCSRYKRGHMIGCTRYKHGYK